MESHVVWTDNVVAARVVMKMDAGGRRKNINMEEKMEYDMRIGWVIE